MSIEEFAADIRTAPVTGGPDVDLSRPLAHHLHSIGYRKARTITTAEELDALPVGSAVGDSAGFLYERYADDEDPKFNYWFIPGDRRPYSTRRIALPATVLHEPEAQA